MADNPIVAEEKKPVENGALDPDAQVGPGLGGPSARRKDEITGVIPKDQIKSLISTMQDEPDVKAKPDTTPSFLLDEAIEQDVPTIREGVPDPWELEAQPSPDAWLFETQPAVPVALAFHQDEEARARWREAVTGLVAEASHVKNGSLRASLLTVAAGLAWQLLEDDDEATRLFDQAIDADPSLFAPHRDLALMRLRRKEDTARSLKELAEGLDRMEGSENLKRLKGRAFLHAAAASIAGAGPADSTLSRMQKGFERAAADALRGSPLAALWTSFRARTESQEEFAALYLGAIRQTHIPTLKAALLADLATGLWCEVYQPSPGREVKPAHLMREVVNLVPGQRLYEALLMLVAAGKLDDQNDILQSRIERGAPEPIHLRAAAIAEALGQFGLATRSLQKLAAPTPTPSADWKLFRLSVAAGRFDQASESIRRLRGRAQHELEAAMFALEEASLAALRQEENDVFKCSRDALTMVNDLETARSLVGSFLLRQGAYRELMDMRSADLVAMVSTHVRRAEILETRLNSPAEAIVEYRQALVQDPSDPQAWFRLDRLLLQNREVEVLAELYSDRLERETDPARKVALLHRAAQFAHFEQGLPRTALAFYARIAEIDPTDELALYRLAEIQFQEGRPAAAIGVLERLLGLSQDPDLRLLLATDWLNHLSQDGPVETAATLVTTMARSTSAWDCFERCCLVQREFGQLIDGLSHPDHPLEREAALMRAWALFTSGAVERAAQDIETYLARYPDDPMAWDLRIAALERAGESQPLRVALRTRTTAHSGPANPMVLSWQAWWEAPFSAETVKQCGEQVMTTADQRVIRATWLAGSTHDRERLRAANALLAAQPDNVRLRAIAEQVTLSTGADSDRLDLYLNWARDSGSLDRDFLIHQMARCYTAMGRYQDALAMWEKLAQVQPEFAPAMLGQIECLGILELEGQASERLAAFAEPLRVLAQSTGVESLATIERLAGVAHGPVKALLFLDASIRAQALGQAEQTLRLAQEAYRLDPGFQSAARQVILAACPTGLARMLPPELAGDAEICHALLALHLETGRSIGVFVGATASGPDPEAIAGLIAAGRHLEDPEFLLDALNAWASISPDPVLCDEIDRCAADIAQFDCGDLQSAADACERALDRQPASTSFAFQLARLSVKAGCVTPERYRRLLDAHRDHSTGSSSLWFLALDPQCPDRPRILREILTRNPEHLLSEWQLLSEPDGDLSPELLAARGRRRASASTLAAAARGFIGTGDAAVAETLCYEALGISTDSDLGAYGGPFQVLSQLLKDQGRDVEAVACGEDLIGRASSRPVKRRLLEWAFGLVSAGGRSGSVIRKALVELVGLWPEDVTLLDRAVARLAEVGEWQDVLELLDLEIDLVRSRHPRLVPLICWEKGEIHRRYLDDPQAALAAYRLGMATGVHTFLLNTAIARLLVEMESWDELVEYYQRALQEEIAPLKMARLHVTIAGIYEFQLLNGRKAFNHYKEALAADATNLSALIGVVRVAERAGLPEEGLPAILSLANMLTGSFQQALLLRAGEIAELHLKDRDTAQHIYLQLARSGGPELAQPGLDSCLLAEVRPAELLQRLQSAEWSAKPGIDFSRAIQTMINPVVEAAWDFKEDTVAAVWAARIYRNGPAGDPQFARDACMRLAELLGDATGAAEILRLGALIGVSAGLVNDTALLRRLIELDPSDDLALLMLEAHLPGGSDAERRIIDARLRAAPQGVNRADALIAMVRHAAVRQEEDNLFNALERLKDVVPELPLSQYFRVALSHGGDDPELEVEQLEAEARRSSSQSRATELLLKAARIRRRNLGQIERAMVNLNEAVRQDPGFTEAYEELREILLAQGDSRGLFELFHKRYLVVTDLAERIGLLGRMAELAFVRLDDRAQATWCHREIVRWDPGNIRSYRILAEIYLEDENYEEAAEMLEAVAQRAKQPSLVIRTHIELAQVYQDKLSLPAKAADSYRAILALKPEHPVALRGLASHCEATGNWTEAIGALTLLGEQAPSRAEAAEFTIRLANVLGKLDTREYGRAHEAALSRSVELAPQDPEALSNLIAHVRRAGALDLIEAVSQQVASRFQLSEPDPDEGAALSLLFDLYDAIPLRRRAVIAASVMMFLGHATQRSEAVRQRATTLENPWRSLRPLPPEQTGSIFPRQTRVALINLLRLIEAPLERAFPSRSKVLGASRKTRIKIQNNHPVAHLASMLGRLDLEVYNCLAPGSRPLVEPASASSLILLFASDFDPEASSDESLWAIANALAPTAMGFSALGRLPYKKWMEVVAFAVRKTLPLWLDGMIPGMGEPEVNAVLDDQLKKIAPDALAEQAQALAGLDHPQLQVQYRLLQVACASLAAVACQDPLVALNAAAGSGLGSTWARGLVPFLLDKSFIRLQQAAGFEFDDG